MAVPTLMIRMQGAEKLQIELPKLAMQFPQLLHQATWSRLEQSIDFATRTLESKVPIGATGRARASVPETRDVVMPSAEAFIEGTVARASVGYGVEYGWYVEFGRGRGRFPPELPIVDWIEQTARGQAFLAEFVSNLKTTEAPLVFAVPRAAFAIRAAHARRGTRFLPPHPPPESLQRAYEETEPRVIEIFNSLPAEIVARAAELLGRMGVR